MIDRPNRTRALKLLSAGRAAEPTVIDVKGAIGPRDAVRARDVRTALASGRGRITLRIDSEGGNLDEALEIVAALERSGRPISAHVARRCKSAAAIVLAAATHRRADLGATFLLHRCEVTPAGSARWTAGRHQARARFLRDGDVRMIAVLARATGTPVDRLEAELATERPLDAFAALRLGLITEIVNVTRPPSREWLARVRAAQSSGQPVSLGLPSYLFGAAFLKACEVTQ